MNRNKTVSSLLRFIPQLTVLILCGAGVNMHVYAQTPSPSTNIPPSTSIKWLDKTILILSGIGGLVGGVGGIMATFKLTDLQKERIDIKQETIDTKNAMIQILETELKQSETKNKEILQIKEERIKAWEEQSKAKQEFIERLYSKFSIVKEFKEIFEGDFTSILRDKEKELENNEAQQVKVRSEQGLQASDLTQLEEENAKLREEIDKIRNSLQMLAQFEEKIESEQDAAKWLADNAENLAEAAASSVLAKDYGVFQESINAYLDWIIFNLQGGQLIPLNEAPPPIPSLDSEYKLAFSFIKKQIPQGMSKEPQGKLLQFFLDYLKDNL